MSERWEWLTDPLEPPYGPPQNRKLRQSPRIVLGFDGLEERDNRRWMETLVNANGAGLWHIPLVADGLDLAGPITAGATTIAVPTAHRRFQPGGNAILQGATPREHQVLWIDTVEADSITLQDPVNDDWPAGSTLTPTIGGKLVSAPVLPRFTGDAGAYSVSFRTDEPIDIAADFGDATYRGYPVFEHAIDWTTDPTYSADRNLATIDNAIGPTVVYDLAGMVLPAIRFDISLTDRAAIGAYRALLFALSGRWSPIWVPSLAQDVEIQSVHSTTAINVAWMGYSDWPIKPNRRDLRIERANGSVIYRRVVSVSDIDTDTERLTLDTALPGGFDAADVVSISFMALCCQDADTNTLRLWSFDVIETALSFRGINNDF